MSRYASTKPRYFDNAIKRGGPFMHLKAYAIDGVALRTGSANCCVQARRTSARAAKTHKTTT